MPRGKGYRKSVAAKRRMAERYSLSSFIDLTDKVMPPLEEKALSDGVKPPLKQKVQNDVTDKRAAPYLKRRDEVLSPQEKKANEQSTDNKTDATISCATISGTTKAVTNKSNTKNAENHSENILTKKKENILNSSTSLYVNNSDHFPHRVLQGSFHQGDDRFVLNSGRQCATNSITAVMMSVLKDVQTWTTKDLNAVLLHGDELYTSMRLQKKINDPTKRGFVSIAELPTVHTLYNTTFTINLGESFSGVIGVDLYDESLRDVSMSIEEALQRALFQFDACLLNIHDYICAVIKAGSTFAVVDSHSRNGKGMVENEGTSVVVYCDDLHMLCNYVNFAMSVNAQGKPFEVTGVKATSISKTTEMSSCKSGQQSSVMHVSCTMASENKCSEDHGKQTNVHKPAILHKLDQTCFDASKKKKLVQTKSKLINVTKLQDNLTDDVIIVDTLNTVSSSCKIGQQSSVTHVSSKTPAEWNKCGIDHDKQTCVDKPATQHKLNQTCLDCSKKTTQRKTESKLNLMDDVIIGDTVNTDFRFKSLTSADQDALCACLQLTNESVGVKASNMCSLGVPCKTKNIKGDGNCLFRSIAQAVCGNEERHLIIRRAVVKHF